MRLDELESEVADVGAMQHQASVLTLLSIREVLSINSVLSIRAILSNKAQLNHAASDISICWVGPTGPVTGPLLTEPLVVVVLAMEKDQPGSVVPSFLHIRTSVLPKKWSVKKGGWGLGLGATSLRDQFHRIALDSLNV